MFHSLGILHLDILLENISVRHERFVIADWDSDEIILGVEFQQNLGIDPTTTLKKPTGEKELPRDVEMWTEEEGLKYYMEKCFTNAASRIEDMWVVHEFRALLEEFA